MNKSHLLINEQALQVLPSIAVLLGLNEAIALQQIHYWLNNQKNAGRVDNQGNKWVYNTYAQWQEDNFPFWSVDKVQRVFLSLEKQGVLIAEQLDAKSRDMTKFYRIDYDKLCMMDDAILRPSNTADLHDVKMNQRLPENTQPKGDLVDAVLQYEQKPTSIRTAIKEYFRLNVNWETKTARQWMEWAVSENITPDQIARAADLWRTDKQFNWSVPTLKGIFEKWPMLNSVGITQKTDVTYDKDGAPESW